MLKTTKICTAGFAAALLIAAGPANAAWGDTEWGASAADTMAVLGEGASDVADEPDDRVWDQHILISMPGSSGDIDVIQEFFFEDGERLSIVKISPVNASECGAFVASMRANFNENINTRRTDFGMMKLESFDFADSENDNVMMLTHLSSDAPDVVTCHITYQPYGDGKPGAR